LAALRLLKGKGDDERKLQRYILALSLVALTAPATTYLRAGCNLVPDVDKPSEFTRVGSDGTRAEFELTHPDALAFATAAAEAFGVGKGDTFEFDKNLAKKDVEGAKKKKPGKEGG
jgi:CRISPR-associated protein Csb1